MRKLVVPSVLIVDDNQADVEWCEIMMRKTSRYPCVYSVNTGTEALNLFQNETEARERYPGCFPPHLIFLDINMPGMNGFEFLEQLGALELESAASSPPTILMVTSSTDPADQARAKLFPMVKQFLIKPLTVETASQIADDFGSRQ